MTKTKNLYFDTAATTPLDLRVANHMHEINKDIYGNPSSIHQTGQKAHNIVERSRKKIAELLHCKQSEIYFTSGGSESNNIALRGVLNSGDHLVTASYEHPAILDVAKYLESINIEVTYVEPNSDGIVSAEDIAKAIKSNTKLVSIMAVNNEIGTINPINQISDMCKEHGIYFHTDAVQYIGKKEISLDLSNIDMLSLGAHKFYGPKGIGAIYIKSGIAINPFIFGGGQEKGIRPGTESPSLISGMCHALEIAMNDLEKNSIHINNMENLFFELLDKTNIKYNVNGKSRLKGIINITFFDYDGHSLLLNLDMRNIAISFGSACASGTAKASPVLLSIGLNEKVASKTVRISIGKHISKNDIHSLIEALESIIK